ncbi:TadE/TadG family type IV pilus assembly protein [Sphingomonas quercus]|uniref:TadE/TadG family type IV pilus assembly protein n=1 Tax=Sphingomonas quercus TaxID=2842451 RepID=UPI00209AA2E8|nr:TadE/TadG family type IV pilus assembly protein [Sphingomonas quercus]
MGEVLKRNEKGAAAVEFALVAPVLLAMLAGIVAYGGWFWMAHYLQQAANDGARAALAGLTASERQTIANATVLADLATAGNLDPAKAAVSVEETSETVVIRIRYDARNNPFFAFRLIPMPPRTIRASAAVRLPPA